MNRPRWPNDGSQINGRSLQWRDLWAWWAALNNARRYTAGLATTAGWITQIGLLNGNHGVPNSTSRPTWTQTDWGVCPYFAGTSTGSSFNSFECQAALNMAAPFSVAAWVNPNFTNGTSKQAYAKIICQRTTALADPYATWALSVDGSSPALWQAVVTTGAAGSSIYATATSSVVLGAWTHVGFCYDGANISIYVNGRYEGQSATTLAVGTSTAVLTIGGMLGNGTNNIWKGYIFDVRVYKRALSAAEWWHLYDPVTRWDLYPVALRRPVVSIPIAAAEGPSTAVRAPFWGRF